MRLTWPSKPQLMSSCESDQAGTFAGAGALPTRPRYRCKPECWSWDSAKTGPVCSTCHERNMRVEPRHARVYKFYVTQRLGLREYCSRQRQLRITGVPEPHRAACSTPCCQRGSCRDAGCCPSVAVRASCANELGYPWMWASKTFSSTNRMKQSCSILAIGALCDCAIGKCFLLIV